MSQNCTHRKLSAFSGVVRGGKATLKLPAGATYEQIILKTNLTAAELTRVEITLNDDKIYNVTSTHLNMLEKYHKRVGKDGYFVIPFSDFSNADRGSVAATAFVTMLNDHITLDVTLSDVIAADKAIQIDTFAIVSTPQVTRTVIPRLYTQTMTATASGDNDFHGLLSSVNKYVRRMHFKTDKMDKLEIKRDGREEGEFHKDVLHFVDTNAGKSWQPSYFHYDPLKYGYMRDFLLPTQHNSEFFFRVSTTEVVQSIEILVEVIEKVA
ncbi:major capsid protein P2 [Vibrio scophthalmi]|uniref:major capsid protein P2 n=1 Tax=Vibrio scophthalmi TaxID=45658 RepID=UPI003AAA6838